MAMLKKLDLTEPDEPIFGAQTDAEGMAIPVARTFRMVLVELVTSARLALNMPQLVERLPLVDRIRDTKEDFILLDSKEYDWLKSAGEKITGFTGSEGDVFMARRVWEAKDVEVEEKSLRAVDDPA